MEELKDEEIMLLLKPEMVFKNETELGEFLHTSIKTPSTRLKYYCNFHKEKSKIVIDSVFDQPKKHNAWHRSDFRYDIGQVLETVSGTITIVNRFKKHDPVKGNLKYYTGVCAIHGEFTISELALMSSCGCPTCGRTHLNGGANSIYSIYPELVKYFKYPEEAKTINPLSRNKRIECVCPDCGHEKTMEVSILTRCGFFCNICSDRISYPNKYVTRFLQQLNINFDTEKMFDWSCRKLYDDYIPEHSLIIENHGLQHYSDGSNFTKRTLSEEQENDRRKYEMAISNGIQHYIVLDCRYSKSEWIKNSIMLSELPTILNFKEDDIDWNECERFAVSNIFKSICYEWNINYDIDELVKKYKLTRRTISNYILHGVELGFCTKSLNDIYLETVNEVRKDAYSKPIHCITDDVYFKTKFEAGEYYKDIFPKTGALKLTTYINQNAPYKGKMFEYITKEEFNNMKELSLTDNSITVIGDKFNIK